MSRQPSSVALAAFLVTAVCSATARSAPMLYVSNFSSGIISKVDLTNTNPSTNTTSFVSGLSSPAGLLFDNDGWLYVAQHNTGTNNAIKKITAGPTTSVWVTGSPLNVPEALVRDTDGNTYTTNQSVNSIIKIAPDLTMSTYWTSGTSVTSLNSLAIRNGYMYVSAQNTQNIAKIDMTNPSSWSIFATGMGTVAGLQFDAAGNLYAASQNQNKVFKITSDGTKSDYITTNLNTPYGLLIMPTGEMLVSNVQSGQMAIRKFSMGASSGTFSSTVSSSGLNTPIYMAYADFGVPVPEPAMGSVMAAAVFTLAVVWRGRRTRSS